MLVIAKTPYCQQYVCLFVVLILPLKWLTEDASFTSHMHNQSGSMKFGRYRAQKAISTNLNIRCSKMGMVMIT